MTRKRKYRKVKEPETLDCTGCKYITHSLNSAPCKFCYITTITHTAFQEGAAP